MSNAQQGCENFFSFRFILFYMRVVYLLIHYHPRSSCFVPVLVVVVATAEYRRIVDVLSSFNKCASTEKGESF